MALSTDDVIAISVCGGVVALVLLIWLLKKMFGKRQRRENSAKPARDNRDSEHTNTEEATESSYRRRTRDRDEDSDDSSRRRRHRHSGHGSDHDDERTTGQRRKHRHDDD